MKQLLALYFLICCSIVVAAQNNNDYTNIGAKVLRIPVGETYSTNTIANYIQANFKTDREKIRAIYTWVTANIQYSKDSMYYKGWSTDIDTKTSAILRRRKGVCENYAELFTSIVCKCGILSFMVTGIAKTGIDINRTSHGWSAVYVDNEWLLCDPTWDEGSKNEPRYFLVSPLQFIETHYPFDPLWQLLGHPISAKEFRQGFTRSKKQEPVFHYTDSVIAFLKLDSLQQLEASSRRMNAAGIENESIKTWYGYNQMKMDIYYHDLDMNLFNAAVEDRNKARSLFNDYVQYRNNRFKPSRPDAAFNGIFVSIDSLLKVAYKKATTIGTKVENYQYDVDGLKNSLDILSAKAQLQKDFLKKYFAASEPERDKMFYQ